MKINGKKSSKNGQLTAVVISSAFFFLISPEKTVKLIRKVPTVIFWKVEKKNSKIIFLFYPLTPNIIY